MLTPPPRLRAVIAMLVLLPLPVALAYDERAWLTSDGQWINATFVRLLGDSAELRTKDNRTLRLPQSLLSQDDQDYLLTSAPGQQKPALGTAKAASVKTPNPAKSAKVDRTQFKRDAGEMKISRQSYKVCETAHFKLLYLPPSEPDDLAELAERMWLDAAFFLGGFRKKWTEHKMAVVMANDDSALEDAMAWGRDLESAQLGAARLDRAGPEGTAGILYMSVADARAGGIFRYVRLLRGCAPAARPGEKGKPLKGVWRPCNVHMLAMHMLRIHLGMSPNFAEAQPPPDASGRQIYMRAAPFADDEFTLTGGYALYKEIALTGRAETRVIGTVGAKKDLVATGGFASGKSWAAELRTMMKMGGEWKPLLNDLMRTNENGAHTKEIAFAWSFARFLMSKPESVAAFSKICRAAAAARDVPNLEEIAKQCGYSGGAELEKAWVKWMNSPGFR